MRSVRVLMGVISISIHAPPRGATGRPARACPPSPISIHAPPRGATPGRSRLSPVGELKNFNSRPSARGDTASASVCGASARFQFTPLREGRRNGQYRPRRPCISIHAPPRGATLSFQAWGTVHTISIHAPPRGATQGAVSDGVASVFQFTPLREGRRDAINDIKAERISIHAPPRGATARGSYDGMYRDISIHAPPRGATCRACYWQV